MTTTSPSSRAPAEHAARALWYAQGVVAKTIPAGRWVRAACKRHLDDLKRKRFPYEFVSDKGAFVCRFIEKLPHTKGHWAAEQQFIHLEPWQCFLIVVMFGWVNKKTALRRFRVAYWEVPRKNGKSQTAAAIGLYMLMADQEFGAEIYSGATSEKQAWEVFRPAKLMLASAHTTRLRERLGAQVCAKALTVESNGSKFEPLIGNPGDGASPSLAIIDEYHEHQTPIFYDTMLSGMGARRQPMLLVITTAGANIAGPCYDKHEEVCKMLEGVTTNEELFGCLWGLDPEDDWVSPASLIKANPNYGVSVDAEFLLSQQRQALTNPIDQSRFKTKHLNVWTSVYAGVMNMQLWKLAEDPMLDEAELATQPDVDAWIAVDLASKSDLCAEIRLFRRYAADSEAHYYLFSRYWLPETAIEEPGPNTAHYAKWVRTGHLIQTDGAAVDFEEVMATVIADARRINPREVVFDPFNAAHMMQKVAAGVGDDSDTKVVEFIQTPANFAVPLDELLVSLKAGRFHHDGHPITTWCMSNMVARPAKKGLVSPIKQKPHQKIDGAIATIMGLARAVTTSETEPSFQMIFAGGGNGE